MTHRGAQRQGDEYFCPKCGKRWDVDEDAPPCEEKTPRRSVGSGRSDSKPKYVRHWPIRQ